MIQPFLQFEVAQIIGAKLVAQEARELLVLFEKGVLPIGAENMMTMLDLVDNGRQFAAQALIQADTEDRADPIGRQPPEAFSTSPAREPVLRVPPVVNEVLRDSPWIMGFACGIGSTLALGILVLFFSWIFRNSFATRPTVAGALYGAGAGLAINAGWRVACPVSTPWHALGAHGTATIATVILGALIGRSLGNRGLHIGGRHS